MRLIATATLLAAVSGSAYADGPSSVSAASSEVAAIRSFFYAGGGYADDGAGGHIFREQMYVERLQPAKGVSQPTPIVFIHGQAQTGTVSPFTFKFPRVIHTSFARVFVILSHHLLPVTEIPPLLDSLSQGKIRGSSRDMLVIAFHLTINPTEILAN
jgi:hypothetical protein